MIIATTLYQTIAKDSIRMGEHNDCAVKAVAIAANMSYDQAHALCAKYGRRRGQGMDTGTLRIALLSEGFDAEPVTNLVQPNGRLYTPVTIGKRCQRGRYIMWSKKHGFAVIDGIVHDWAAVKRYRIIGGIHIRIMRRAQL